MNEQKLKSTLDAALTRITEETGLVGGVVDVIKGGKTVFTYSYGWADRERQIPPDQDTLFDVASCSKAWTAMLAAKCVDEGLIGWDDPLKQAIPWFTLSDSYAGSHLSVRDTVCHRSGLPGHDFQREKIFGDRENLARRAAFLEFNTGFRNKYQYNNLMFVLLGYLEEVLRGGMSWDDQIREYIAKPLGIDPIRIRGDGQSMEGICPALPYVSDGFTSHRCSWSTNHHSAPCGGIRISMKNMAKWIAAMSRGGVTPDGSRLCSEVQYQELLKPIISASEEDSGHLKNTSYAMGWLNSDYEGHTVLHHSGGLEGFNTQVGFIAGEDKGYVMCFNTGTTPASEIARDIVLDVLVHGEPTMDWEPTLQNWLRRRDAMRKDVLASTQGIPLTFSEYPGLTGVYRHPAYDTFEILEEDGQLRFFYGSFTANLFLQADGSITGWSGHLDSLTPCIIKLFPDGDDLRLQTPDSELRLFFKKEK